MVSVCSIGGHRNELSARSVTATTLEADNWPFVGFHGCFHDYKTTDGQLHSPDPAFMKPRVGVIDCGAFFPALEEKLSKMFISESTELRSEPRGESAGRKGTLRDS